MANRRLNTNVPDYLQQAAQKQEKRVSAQYGNTASNTTYANNNSGSTRTTYSSTSGRKLKTEVPEYLRKAAEQQSKRVTSEYQNYTPTRRTYTSNRTSSQQKSTKTSGVTGTKNQKAGIRDLQSGLKAHFELDQMKNAKEQPLENVRQWSRAVRVADYDTTHSLSQQADELQEYFTKNSDAYDKQTLNQVQNILQNGRTVLQQRDPSLGMNGAQLSGYINQLRGQYGEENRTLRYGSPEEIYTPDENGQTAVDREAEAQGRIEALRKWNSELKRQNKLREFETVKQNPDYDEKNRYQSTANGNERTYGAFGALSNSGFNDITYDLVNQNREAIKARQNMNPVAADVESREGTDQQELQRMHKDEIKLFNYLYQQDPEKAREYLNTLRPELMARQTQHEQEEWTKKTKEDFIGASLLSVPTRYIGGLDAMVGMAADKISGRELDTNAGYLGNLNISNAIRQTGGEMTGDLFADVLGTATALRYDNPDLKQKVIDKFGGAVKEFGATTYGSVMSQLDQLWNLGMSGGMQNAALVLMSASAVPDTIVSAKKQGVDDRAAFGLGIIAGVAEYFSEKVSLEALLDMESIAKNGFLKYVGKAALAEGSEEVVSGVINLAAQEAIAGKNSDFKLNVKQHEMEGMSHEEAVKAAWADQIDELFQEFVGGAIAGGGMATVMGGAHEAQGASIKNDLDPNSQYRQMNNSALLSFVANVQQTQQADQTSQNVLNAAAEQMASDGTVMPEAVELIMENDNTKAMLEQATETENIETEEDVLSALQKYTAQQTEPQQIQTEQVMAEESTSQPQKANMANTEAQSEPVNPLLRSNAVSEQLMTMVENSSLRETFGAEGQKIFNSVMRNELQKGKTIKDAYDAVSQAYNAGLNQKVGDTLRFGLSPTDAKRLYYAGSQDAVNYAKGDIDKMDFRSYQNVSTKDTGVGVVRDDFVNSFFKTKEQQRTLNAVDTIANSLGVKVHFVEHLDANGFYNPDTKEITIAADADVNATFAWVFGHEMTHRLQQTAPQEYDVLKRTVAAAMGSAKFNAAVQDELRKAQRDGIKMTQLGAQDEAVANFVGDLVRDRGVLEKFISDNIDTEDGRTVLQKIRDFFREILNKIKGNKVPELDMSIESVQDAINALDAALGTAVENVAKFDSELQKRVEQQKAVSTDEELRCSTRNNTQIIDNAAAWNEDLIDEDSPRFIGKRNVPKSVLKTARTVMNEMKAILEKPNIAKLLPDEENVLSGTKYDHPIKGEKKRTTVFGNDSYGYSVENSTICIRSLAMELLLDRCAELMGHSLSTREAIALSQMAWSMTDQPTCQYCYVFADRLAQRQARDLYIDQREAVLKSVGKITSKTQIVPDSALETSKGKKFDLNTAIENNPKFEKQLRAYNDFLNKRDNTENQRKRFRMFLENAKSGAAVVTREMVASEQNMVDAVNADPSLQEEMKDIYTYSNNASHAKAKVEYTAYNNDILKLADEAVELMNREYGVRFYSYSDFHPAFILENMQMFLDAAVRGLKGLAYTKDLDYVRIFADTGANINISLKMIDGTTEMDAMQGADWEGAKQLRELYPGVGTVMICTSDEQVNWALDQDWIDTIIPYHVCFSAEVQKAFNWKNYQQFQSDKKMKGWRKGVDHASISPYQHGNNKTKYLRLCKENNLEPRFPQWKDHKNYMKLVNETRRAYNKTPKLQPKFNLDAAKKSISDMQKRGGYENPFGGSIEEMNGIAEEYVERFKQEFPDINNLEEGWAATKEFGQKTRFSLKDSDYTISENTARWTEERIDSLIRDYGASNPDYSQAYAVLMNPRDYLKLTLSDDMLDKWNEGSNDPNHPETYSLDEDRLRENTQTPFLSIYSNDGTEVQGHEGRHRMRALLEAGVTSVPVVIRDMDTKYSKTNLESMTLSSQDFGEDPVNNGAKITVTDLVPIKEANREELIRKFGGDANVRFSRKANDARYLELAKDPEANAYELQKMVDEAAERAGYHPRHTYHGTLAYGFTVFDKAKAQVGGNSGAGFYFSTNEDDSGAHYADIEGADNFFKASNLAEVILDAGEWNGMEVDDYDQALQIAKDELNKTPGTYDVYLKYDNPYIRNFRDTTNLYDVIMGDFDESVVDRNDYDSDDDYEQDLMYYREEHAADKLYGAIYDAYMDLEDQYEIIESPSLDTVYQGLAEGLLENESLTWDDITKVLWGNDGFLLTADNWTDSADGTAEFERSIIENLGFDAIIDKEVDVKFGQLSREMMKGTEHHIMFSPNQIKSSDPVTYDDDGNVIPLSERFNPKNNDLRYSRKMGNLGKLGTLQVMNMAKAEDTTMKERAAENTTVSKIAKDTLGNVLSQGQRKYFKNSKMVDENGNLIVMYHGTMKGGFSIFNPVYSKDGISLFFTDDREVAESYTREIGETIPDYKEGSYGKTIYPVYLNITNPMIIDAKGHGWKTIPNGEAEVSISERKVLGDFAFTSEADYNSFNEKYDLENLKRAYEEAQEEGSAEYNGEELDEWELEELYNESISDAEKEYRRYYKNNSSSTITAREFFENYEDYGWYELEALQDTYDENGQTLAEIKEAADYDYESAVQIFEEYLNERIEDGELEEGFLDDLSFPVIPRAGEEATKNDFHTTRWYAKQAAESGYDGVIIKDVYDRIYGSGRATVAIVFDSNQVKSVDNLNPTDDPDIRYSRRSYGTMSNLVEQAEANYRNERVQNEFMDAATKWRTNMTALSDFGKGGFNARMTGLVKAYRPEISEKESEKIVRDMRNLTREVARRPEITYTEIADKANAIAAQIMWGKGGITDNLKYSEDAAQAVEDIRNDMMAQMVNTVTRGEGKYQKLSQEFADYRDKAQKNITEVRNKRDARIRKMKDSRKKASESRKAGELRAKIQKHVKSLSDLLLKPTDQKHIPKNLQSTVAKLLESINLESTYKDKNGEIKTGAATKRTVAFQELRTIYTEMAKGGHMVIDPDLMGDNYTTGLFDEVIAMGDTSIMAMNSDQLKKVWRIVRAVETAVRTANKLFIRARYQDVSQVASVLHNQNEDKTKSNINLGKAQKLLSLDMLTPEAYFHRLGDAGDYLFKEMRNAQDRSISIYDEAVQYGNENLKGADFRKLEKEMHEVTLGGQKVSLSTAQLMELYLLMNRDQAREHILNPSGGLKLRDVKKGVKMEYHPDPIKGIKEKEIFDALTLLSPQQIAWANSMQQYVAGPLADHGNQASMQVYGYEKFTDDNYWKITSNEQDVRRDIGQTKGVITSVAGKGMAQPLTPKANTSIMLGSIFDTYSHSVMEMADYAAWLATMEDINRIRNYQAYEGEGDERHRAWTMQQTFDRVFGNGGAKYLETLMSHLANGVNSEQNFFGGFTGNYKAAVIGYNIRVVIQQPTAIFRATDMISPKYLAAGAKTNVLKGWEEAKKYCPIAVWKDWGFFDIGTGRQMKSILFKDSNLLEKIKSTGMWAPGMADSIGWGWLWNSIKKEVKATTKLEGEEFYKRVAERFNDVVDHTQVVDGVLQRSDIMRRSDALTKMAVSFMAEPMKQYNMLMSAAYDCKNSKGEKLKIAKRRMARCTGALLLAGILNAVAQSIIDGLRNDDRDKDYWEKFLAAMFGEGGEDKNRFVEFIQSNTGDMLNPAGYIPFAKDILSLIEGYDVSRMDMDAMSESIKSAGNLIKAIQGNSKDTLGMAIVNAVASFGQLLGISFKNLKREVLSVASTSVQATGSYVAQYNFMKMQKSFSASSNKSEYMQLLYDAYDHDRKAYNYLYNEYIKRSEFATSDKSSKEYVDDKMKAYVKGTAKEKYWDESKAQELEAEREAKKQKEKAAKENARKKANLTSEQWLQYEQLLVKHDENLDGSSSQKEVYDTLMEIAFDQKQKEAIWKSYGYKKTMGEYSKVLKKQAEKQNRRDSVGLTEKDIENYEDALKAHDSDKNGSASKEEVYQTLMDISLSMQQKELLWSEKGYQQDKKPQSISQYQEQRMKKKK